MCVVPPKHDGIAGDIPPGNFKYHAFGKSDTDDKSRYATFLKHTLPRLQGQDVEVEPDFYVSFGIFFDFNRGGFKQLSSAGICKKKFGSTNNKCRNRTYYSFSYYGPEVLANIIVDDILKSEPLIRKCPNA
jgi:hypothetical protein